MEIFDDQLQKAAMPAEMPDDGSSRIGTRMLEGLQKNVITPEDAAHLLMTDLVPVGRRTQGSRLLCLAVTAKLHVVGADVANIRHRAELFYRILNVPTVPVIVSLTHDAEAVSVAKGDHRIGAAQHWSETPPPPAEQQRNSAVTMLTLDPGDKFQRFRHLPTEGSHPASGSHPPANGQTARTTEEIPAKTSSKQHQPTELGTMQCNNQTTRSTSPERWPTSTPNGPTLTRKNGAWSASRSLASTPTARKSPDTGW